MSRDDDIADDYALTMLAYEKLIDEWIGNVEEADQERMRELAKPTREAMLEMLEHVKTTYGGAEQYLLGAGVSREQIARIRDRLVERSSGSVMDDVAREYLLIGLSLGELQDGVVDAYFGPPEVKEQALADKASAADLAKRSAALRARLDEVADAQRARWLDRQLIATETIARQLDGEEFPYNELVQRCFDATPEATPPGEYARVRADLERLLPGKGDLRERLEAHEATLTVPVDKLGPIVEWVTAQLRLAALEVFSVPDGEDLSISLVTNEPWGAYNWYDGNLHSRIEVNTDLPVRAPSLMALLAHEAYPGHHLEHTSKEQRLVREQGRYESSVQLINTPEAYISEGLAETGVRFTADEPALEGAARGHLRSSRHPDGRRRSRAQLADQARLP